MKSPPGLQMVNIKGDIMHFGTVCECLNTFSAYIMLTCNILVNRKYVFCDNS
jgi:hypothetical protein